MTVRLTGIAHVDDAQAREDIAARERKAVIKRTPEILEAFANGVDRRNPAPEPKRDRSRDD